MARTGTIARIRRWLGSASIWIAPIALAMAIGSFVAGQAVAGVSGLVLAVVALYLALFVRKPARRRPLKDSVLGAELIGPGAEDSARVYDDGGGFV